MNIYIRVLIFLFVNAIGFYAGLTLFIALIGIIDYDKVTFDKIVFEQTFFIRHFMTWAVCAIFSFSNFFLKGAWRHVFLLAPIFIPSIYTLFYVASHL